MTLFYFVLGVALVIVVGVCVEWLLYRQRSDKDTALFKRLSRAPLAWLGSLRDRSDELLTPDYMPDSADFKDWVKRELNTQPRLQDWLLALPETGFKALTQQLADFCHELNINLEWLVNGDMKREPHIENVAQEVIVAYCEACLKSIKIQDNLAQFQKYQASLDRLSQPRNRDASQRLLEELRAHALAEPASPDLLLASEDERYHYVLSTLRQASVQDPETFDRLMSQVDKKPATQKAV